MGDMKNNEMTERPTAAELDIADFAVTLDEARGVIRRLTRLVGNLERERDEAREQLKAIHSKKTLEKLA